jgi:hypothetical protein
VLPTSLHPLRFAVSATEESEYGDAISGAILGAAKVLTDEMESGEVVAPNMAGNYLADNSLSKLTGDISETTTDRLRTAIADAWDKGGSYDQIVSAITDKFDDFSETRAGLIAQTEAVDAYNYGRSETARAVGLDEKSWETESDEPCETCLANEAQGWIDIDDDFDSGDSEPTAHPNCECVANYRKSSDEDEEE